MTRRKVLWSYLGMVFMVLLLGIAGADDDDIGVVYVDVDFIQTTLEERILKASVILVGKVEAIGDLTHPEVISNPFLSMEVTLSVSRWIKGESPREITLITAQQDTTIAIYSPAPPRFAVGEEILLLTSPWKAGYYQTVGWHKAKYSIIDDRIAGSDVRVEEFVQQIQELLAGERSKITLNLPGHTVPSASVEETTWGQVKTNFK